MKLTNWDPFRELENLFHRSRLQDQTLPAGTSGYEDIAHADWHPTVDISETKNAFEIHAELPGMRKDDIKIAVDEGVLTLRGQRQNILEEEDKDKKYHRIERSYGSFARSFALPKGTAPKDISADYKDGVLLVNVPKTIEASSESLDIKIH